MVYIFDTDWDIFLILKDSYLEQILTLSEVFIAQV